MLARYEEAKMLLKELLASGRISKHEFDVLSTTTGNQNANNHDSREYDTCSYNAPDDIYIPGNIALQATRRDMESISRVFNTMELLEQILYQARARSCNV